MQRPAAMSKPPAAHQLAQTSTAPTGPQPSRQPGSRRTFPCASSPLRLLRRQPGAHFNNGPSNNTRAEFRGLWKPTSLTPSPEGRRADGNDPGNQLSLADIAAGRKAARRAQKLVEDHPRSRTLRLRTEWHTHLCFVELGMPVHRAPPQRQQQAGTPAPAPCRASSHRGLAHDAQNWCAPDHP